MMRAFAIGLAIATMWLIMVPVIIVMGEPTHDETAQLSIVSFTIGFFLHWGVAEWWIRRTQTHAKVAIA